MARKKLKLEKAIWRDKCVDVLKEMRAHWQRVETGGTGLGVPDWNVGWRGLETWFELKRVEGNRVLLRPEQIGWHLKRAHVGCRSWIIAYWERFDLWLVWPGHCAREVRAAGVAAPGSRRYPGGSLRLALEEALRGSWGHKAGS